LHFLVDKLLFLLSNVTEDVVEHKVPIRLASEDEGLSEFAVGEGFVGDFTNHLDDDVLVGSLGVDVGDANLAVLELELLDAVVDGLSFSRRLVRGKS